MRKILIFVALAAALGLGFALRPLLEPDTAPTGSAAAPPVQQAPVNGAPAPAMNLPDFAGLVDRAGPAVVNITTLARARGVQDFPGIDPDSPFAPFFRHFGIPQQPPQPPREIMQGQGSGFIVRNVVNVWSASSQRSSLRYSIANPYQASGSVDPSAVVFSRNASRLLSAIAPPLYFGRG